MNPFSAQLTFNYFTIPSSYNSFSGEKGFLFDRCLVVRVLFLVSYQITISLEQSVHFSLGSFFEPGSGLQPSASSVSSNDFI